MTRRETFAKDVEKIMREDFKGEGPVQRLQAGVRLHKLLQSYSENYLVKVKEKPELLIQAQEYLKSMTPLDIQSMSEGLVRATACYEKYLSEEMAEYGVVDIDVLGIHIALFGIFNPALHESMYGKVKQHLNDFYMLMNAGYLIGGGHPLAAQDMKTMFAAASITTGRKVY